MYFNCSVFELFFNTGACAGLVCGGGCSGRGCCASSSIGANSFTGSSASVILVISGSTSDIYIVFYKNSIYFLPWKIWRKLGEIIILIFNIIILIGLF